MKNKLFLFIIMIIPFFIITNKVEAKDISTIDSRVTLEKCPIFGDPNQDGSGYTEVFDPSSGKTRKIENKESTAHFLQEVLNFIKYLGPALAIVLTVVEFVKAAAAQDNDALARAAKKTGWRVGLCIVLFFIPNIINTVFTWFGWYGTCGLS